MSLIKKPKNTVRVCFWREIAEINESMKSVDNIKRNDKWMDEYLLTVLWTEKLDNHKQLCRKYG